MLSRIFEATGIVNSPVRRSRRRWDSGDDDDEEDDDGGGYRMIECTSPQSSCRSKNLGAATGSTKREKSTDRRESTSSSTSVQSAVQIVEKSITTMFGACTSGGLDLYTTYFNEDSKSSPRGDATATTDPSSTTRSRSQQTRQARSKSRERTGCEGRSSSRQRTVELGHNCKLTPQKRPAFSLGRNAEIAFTCNDDVSALSGFTLDEMARKQAQLDLFIRSKKGYVGVDSKPTGSYKMSSSEDSSLPLQVLTSSSSGEGNDWGVDNMSLEPACFSPIGLSSHKSEVTGASSVIESI